MLDLKDRITQHHKFLILGISQYYHLREQMTSVGDRGKSLEVNGYLVEVVLNWDQDEQMELA